MIIFIDRTKGSEKVYSKYKKEFIKVFDIISNNYIVVAVPYNCTNKHKDTYVDKYLQDIYSCEHYQNNLNIGEIVQKLKPISSNLYNEYKLKYPEHFI